MGKNTFGPGLYVAATPLGHLSDITERVREGLAACDQLYAEDTRRAQQLLSALGLSRPKSSIYSLHDHNELAMTGQVLAALESKQSVILISDAGTPAISDPGFQVVDAAWKQGFAVHPLPGPSAVIAALSVCGFARWPMSFWGFAPSKASARRQWLRRIKGSTGLAVIFEAPHRAEESLTDCAELFGPQTPMLFGRELTKQHETIFRSTIAEIQLRVQTQNQIDPGSTKGEMVWVFDLGEKTAENQEAGAARQQLEQWASVLASEMPAAAAAKCMVKMLGVSREDAYNAVLTAANLKERST